MPAFHRILLLVTVAVALVEARKSLRAKRSLLELAGAIECSTGRSPLRYVMYGCYCGLGGKGWPRDRADWCCHKHDCCYGEAEQRGCSTKTVQYKWWCDDKEPECEDVKDKCQRKLCDCDRDLAKCLGRAGFHDKYVLWPNIMCGDDQPTCHFY